MNHAKNLVGLALTAILASGCAGSGNSTASGNATEADYQAALAAAKVSIKAAQANQYEWRDTGKILKKAEEAAKSGNFSSAQTLALTAKRQGELAVAQAKSQQNAGPM